MARRTRPRGTRFSLRKSPRQERSRATVEAILQAATDILVRQGASRLTTNRIAERAGVNIASLYQYFPSKHAIIAELRRRHGVKERTAVRRVLVERRGGDLEATVRALVSMGVAAHAVNPELHRVFNEELPPLRYADVSRTDAPLIAEFRALLARSATGLTDPDLALWMVATVANAVLHCGVVERPDDFSNGAVVDELVTLLVRYLKRSTKWRDVVASPYDHMWTADGEVAIRIAFPDGTAIRERRKAPSASKTRRNAGPSRANACCW